MDTKRAPFGRILMAPWRLLLWLNYGDTSAYSSSKAAEEGRLRTRRPNNPDRPTETLDQITDQAASLSPYSGFGGTSGGPGA